MAKTSLGELETAPGALKRESAHIKREFVKNTQQYIDSANSAANTLHRNGRVYENFARLARRTGGELKQTPDAYLLKAKESFDKAGRLYDEADSLSPDVRKAKWGARADSCAAFFQTLKARIF